MDHGQAGNSGVHVLSHVVAGTGVGEDIVMTQCQHMKGMTAQEVAWKGRTAWKKNVQVDIHLEYMIIYHESLLHN